MLVSKSIVNATLDRESGNGLVACFSIAPLCLSSYPTPPSKPTSMLIRLPFMTVSQLRPKPSFTASGMTDDGVLVVVVVVVVVDLWRWAILVGIVLIGTLVLNIVLVVHVTGALCCMFASLVSVVFVHAVCFSKLVNFSADEASQDLLRKLMVHSLACQWLATELG